MQPREQRDGRMFSDLLFFAGFFPVERFVSGKFLKDFHETEW